MTTATTPIRPDYQQRVYDELAELEERHKRLKHFILRSEQFEQLPQEQQDLLRQQETVMYTYASILHRRISLFGEN